MTMTGRLQPLGQVEGLRAQREALGRVLGEQQDVLGVAVRGIGAGQDVRLLRAGRHAGGRPAALDVEQHHRHLGEIGQPQELAHQRDAGAGGGGEGARPVPAGADGDADGGQLVLGLHDAVEVPAVLGHAQALGVGLERLRQRGGGRDRIPGAHRGARVDGAEAGRRIARHQDLALGALGRPHPDRQRAVELLRRMVPAQRHRLHVGGDELLLALELGRHGGAQHLKVDVEQRRERADIHHVLEQLALARVAPFPGAHLGDGDAQHLDVVARPHPRQRGIVEQPAAGDDLAQVLLVGLRVHGDHQVDAVAARQVARLRHPHLVPGRQALDVGGKDVLRADGDAHAEQRLGKDAVGGSRARAVHRGELHHKIVDAAHVRSCLVRKGSDPAPPRSRSTTTRVHAGSDPYRR